MIKQEYKRINRYHKSRLRVLDLSYKKLAEWMMEIVRFVSYNLER